MHEGMNCQSCAACCSLEVDGELIACRHLVVGERFACRIYETRPQVCRDYDCIAHDVSLAENPLVRTRAIRAMLMPEAV